jgi:hypothetical protein
MSMLHERTFSRFDLEAVWKSQSCPAELNSIFKEQLVWVYHRLNSEGGLVSERAKSPKTWEAMKRRNDDPFSSFDWGDYVISETEAQAFRASWSSTDSGLVPQQLGQITSLGLGFWDHICLLGSQGAIDDKDYETANRIRGEMVKGRVLTEALVQKALDFLTRLDAQGVDIEQLRNEKKAESDFFDVSKALVRLKDLNQSDWNSILSFEEIILKGGKINSKQWQGLRNTKKLIAERGDPSIAMIQLSIACIDEVNRRFNKSY